MLALPASVRAQTGFWDRFLPRVHYFEPLVADPLEPRMGIGLIQTNVFERAIEGQLFPMQTVNQRASTMATPSATVPAAPRSRKRRTRGESQRRRGVSSEGFERIPNRRGICILS